MIVFNVNGHAEVTLFQIDWKTVSKLVLFKVLTHGWVVLQIQLQELDRAEEYNDSHNQYCENTSDSCVHCPSALQFESWDWSAEDIKTLEAITCDKVEPSLSFISA